MTSALADSSSAQRAPIAIGSRLELFVDQLLIDSLSNTTFKMHEPQLASQPSSPACGAYMTVFKDEDRYRAYFRQYAPDYTGPKRDGNLGEVILYAESQDGCTWTMPRLGLFEIAGNRDNSAVLAAMPPFCHNFAPFRDSNPGAAPQARYKALAGTHPEGGKGSGTGLFAFQSPDAIHWQPMSDQAVLTHADFGFDSQNVSFWSEAEQCYVCYFRTWASSKGRLRTITRATSPDFRHWSEPVCLDPNRPGENLYTSQTHPYFRAPHIYIALPTRYRHDRGSSTDILFMSTRAGSIHYDRLFTEAFIRPGLDPARWGNRANYAAWGVVPTGPAEMSIYHGPAGRRYTLRTDGFVSINAGADPGEVLTRPITFTGGELVVNFSTSAAGSVGVELQHADGSPIPGFTLADCVPLVGDTIEQVVAWKDSPSLASLAGQPVRLRWSMLEADIYSFRFR